MQEDPMIGLRGWMWYPLLLIAIVTSTVQIFPFNVIQCFLAITVLILKIRLTFHHK